MSLCGGPPGPETTEEVPPLAFGRAAVLHPYERSVTVADKALVYAESQLICGVEAIDR